MPRKPKRRKRYRRVRLTIARILDLADAYHAEHGRWPKRTSGAIPDELDFNWRRIDNALRYGLRGLDGGSSLAQLLAVRRKVRNRKRLPILTPKVIRAWAEAHHRRTGEWPNEHSGPVHGQPGEVWANINAALREGGRSMRGGTSLAQFLAQHLGIRNRASTPPLTVAQILAWADAHHQRTGRWPKRHSGPIADAPGETWDAVGSALRLGLRGLSGGSSLAKLLAEHRGVRHKSRLPDFTVAQVLAWADAHHQRTGAWPQSESGPIVDAPGETWLAVRMALVEGGRGFPGGSSLARLLAEHRGVRNRSCLPEFTLKQIKAWAIAHRERTGKWPTAKSGPVEGAPGESWKAIASALVYGHRGLPKGLSIARVLKPLKEKRS